MEFLIELIEYKFLMGPETLPPVTYLNKYYRFDFNKLRNNHNSKWINKTNTRALMK